MLHDTNLYFVDWDDDWDDAEYEFIFCPSCGFVTMHIIVGGVPVCLECNPDGFTDLDKDGNKIPAPPTADDSVIPREII